MASPEPNLMFGQYRLLRELNRGATAIVYEALDTSRNKRVAAKVRLLERVIFVRGRLQNAHGMQIVVLVGPPHVEAHRSLHPGRHARGHVHQS